MKIYFNPSCSKCVVALDLVREQGVEPEIVEYLNNVPSKDELKNILALLRLRPFDLVRIKEPLFIEKFEGHNLSDEEWLDVLIENPELIERPIVIHEGKAIIGRPPEKILDLIQ